MATPSQSRFTSQNKSTHERLSTNTVGLVALSDFRKRRAEVLEQQEREAREVASAGSNTPDRSQTATPAPASDQSEPERPTHKKKKRPKTVLGNKLSFAGDEDEEGTGAAFVAKANGPSNPTRDRQADTEGPDNRTSDGDAESLATSAGVRVLPRVLTNAALRREAAEREALRKEFLVLQAAVKAAEIAVPFVFYDGTDIPGGIVRVKKGDFIWVFLDKSRKVGANRRVGGGKIAHARREWARVGVDDLMMVRGNVIIPHHYDFYFFIINKSVGPGRRRLFDYSAERPPSAGPATGQSSAENESLAGGLNSTAAKEVLDDEDDLEGAHDDPTFTKVVDRRWYERNKHIYPASAWQDFDPEKDYEKDIRRDIGGNAFFFSK